MSGRETGRLAPCPFCGSSSAPKLANTSAGVFGYVRCFIGAGGCGAVGPSDMNGNLAAYAWGRRSAEAKMLEALEAVAERGFDCPKTVQALVLAAISQRGPVPADADEQGGGR